MKGNLLLSNGCLEEALRCYEEAYDIHPDESYYVMAGKGLYMYGESGRCGPVLPSGEGPGSA